MTPRRLDFGAGSGWCDVAGDVFAYASGHAIAFVRVRPVLEVEVLAIVPLSEPPMFVRVAVDPLFGDVAAFAKGHDTGAAFIIRPGGATIVGTTHGNNPGAVYQDGHTFVFRWVEAPGVLATLRGSTAIQREPILPAPDGQFSSTGILDLAPDGTVIWADARRSMVIGPWTLTKPIARGDVWVGQSDPPAIRVSVDGQVFTAIDAADGFAEDPHLSVLLSGRLLVSAFTVKGASLAVIDPPYPDPELPPMPLPTFTHPVFVSAFKDEAGKAGTPRAEWDFGTFTEDRAFVADPKTRTIFCQDDANAPVIPAGLRPCDSFWLETYPLANDTPASAAARWRTNATLLLNRWPGDCGIVAPFYCQGGAPPNELWTVAEMLAFLDRIPEIVNLSPRIKVVACFAYDRLNGMTAHPELLARFRQFVAASPGVPTLTPIPATKPPPPPPTPPPPVSPKEPTVNESELYGQIVLKESREVWDAYVHRTGHAPAIPDMYHNCWRRLREKWSHRDILHDINGEPLEDGGAGGSKEVP